jgi:hypothetical protein
VAKAITTIRQTLNYKPAAGAWFAANQALFNQVASFYLFPPEQMAGRERENAGKREALHEASASAAALVEEVSGDLRRAMERAHRQQYHAQALDWLLLVVGPLPHHWPCSAC